MRYFVTFFIAVIAILAICVFNPPEPAENDRTLKISAYLYDKSAADPNEWYENKDMRFELEELKPGEVRLLATPEAIDMYNYNILFEYEDGIVTVESDYVQITKGEHFAPWYKLEKGNDMARNYSDRIYGYNMYLRSSGYFTFYPIGSGICSYAEFDEKIPAMGPNPVAEIGQEYYVTVKAFHDDSDEFPVAEIELKFVVLKDESIQAERTGFSHFCSIELIEK
ncbi:MAG: hypothetical protein HFE63_04690 [Clostridiales bacterium]|nr:hypothetical protein [Clostridiales bacterium]